MYHPSIYCSMHSIICRCAEKVIQLLQGISPVLINQHLGQSSTVSLLIRTNDVNPLIPHNKKYCGSLDDLWQNRIKMYKVKKELVSFRVHPKKINVLYCVFQGNQNYCRDLSESKNVSAPAWSQTSFPCCLLALGVHFAMSWFDNAWPLGFETGKRSTTVYYLKLSSVPVNYWKLARSMSTLKHLVLSQR